MDLKPDFLEGVNIPDKHGPPPPAIPKTNGITLPSFEILKLKCDIESLKHDIECLKVDIEILNNMKTTFKATSNYRCCYKATMSPHCCYKATGLCLGNYQGGGIGSYKAKTYTSDTMADLKDQIANGIKDGSIGKGNFESIRGAVMEISTIYSFGGLTKEEKDFLKDCMLDEINT